MPPRIITEDELRALPPEYKTFGTLYTPGYRTYWGDWEIVRELFQNSLDEHDELGIRAIPVLDLTSEGLIIKDYGRGLGIEGLLFKERKVTEDLRGTFGEGLKIACNTALRLGYDVVIESPTRSIEAVYARRKVNGEELELHFIAKPQRPGIIGTTTLIKGYTGPLFRDRFTQFIPAPVHTKEITVGRFSRLNAIYREPPNRLYVRDIYVKDLSTDRPSRFSYNLWEIEVDPDRRAEKSIMNLQQAITNLWASVSDQTLIQQFLEDARDREKYESDLSVSWRARDLIKKFKSEWESAWIDLYSTRAVLWTDEGWAKAAEMYGYTTIRYPYWTIQDLLAEVVPTDRSVSYQRIEELKKPKPVGRHELTPDQLKHLEALELLHSQTFLPNLPPLMPANIPIDPRTGIGARGCYDPGENIIYIDVAELDTMSSSLEVYFHEMGHFISEGAMDGTNEHVEGIQKISAMAVKIMLEDPNAGHPIWREVIWP